MIGKVPVKVWCVIEKPRDYHCFLFPMPLSTSSKSKTRCFAKYKFFSALVIITANPCGRQRWATDSFPLWQEQYHKKLSCTLSCLLQIVASILTMLLEIVITLNAILHHGCQHSWSPSTTDQYLTSPQIYPSCSGNFAFW